MDTEISVSTAEEHSPAAPARTRTRDLSIPSPSLYHRAIAVSGSLHNK